MAGVAGRAAFVVGFDAPVFDVEGRVTNLVSAYAEFHGSRAALHPLG